MLPSKIAKAAFYFVAGALLVPCVGTLSTLQMNAWAQPAEPQVKAAWDKLQADSVELEATNPQGAITRYQKFFEEEGYRSPAVGLPLSLRIARLYQIDLKNYDKAIEIYDWALGLYKNQPDAILLQRGRLAAVEAQNRAEGAPPNGGLQPSTAGGAAPWAVVPKAAATGQLGVNLSPPTNGAGLGITLPTAIAKPGGLGITLPAAPNQNAMAVTPSLPPGRALGWQPGRQRCVTALTQQGGGIVWVATEDSGVWRYDPAAPALKRWRQFTAQDGLGDNSAYALAVDKAGRVWAGTLNHGVSVWNGEEWKNYGVLDGPLGERVFDIAVCPTDGDVWIATNAGLTRYSMKGDSWSYVTRADGLPSDQIEAIAFDKSGNIVLGTQCDGVALAQAADGYKTWRVVQGPQQMPLTATGEGLPSNLINDVLVARDGTIYAATTTGLAWSSDGGAKWAYVRGEDYAAKVQGLYGGAPAGWKEQAGAVLAEDYVSCLAEDEAGRLWVGHWKEGSEMLQMQSGPAGLGVKEVFYRRESGFVKAMLPRAQGALLLARYDEGLSYGSAATEKNDESPKAAIEPKIGVGDMTIEFPLTSKAKAVIEPQIGVVNATASLPRIAKAKAAIEPKTIVANTTASFPSAAKAPTLAELNAMIALLDKVEPLDPKTPVMVALSDDWRTQGDWLGRYGRYYARLHAIISPSDYVWGAGAETVPFVAHIGKNAAPDDSVRYWVQWLYTDNPHSLEMPPVYYDSRLKKGLVPPPDGTSSPPKNRRQAELDDHGEVYPMTQDGPDIFLTFHVPKGDFYLSFYDFNKDGEDTNNRLRDYRLSLRSHPLGVALDDIDGFEQWPELAHARILDFRGGVYKRFLMRGPQTLTVRVSRNYSFNTILAGVFLDKVTEEPEPYFTPAGNDDQERLTRIARADFDNKGGTAAKAEEDAVDLIWQQLEKIKQDNPEWSNTTGRLVYARLLPWLKNTILDNDNEGAERNYLRLTACYYQMSMLNKWEFFQKKRGLLTAREIEKSLVWDGKSDSSGHGRNAVIQSLLKP